VFDNLMSDSVDGSGERVNPAQESPPGQYLEPNFEKDLGAITDLIQSATDRCQGDTEKLLCLLRMLEREHRNIREENFLTALPSNRQALYSLLRSIEREGGWPYIPGISLRILLQHLDEQAANDGRLL
jgi:hypothetical protein